MRKIISMVLAMLMVLSMATAAFAEETPVTTGTINITDVALDEDSKLLATYNVYQIMNVNYNDAGNYSYNVVDAWRPFFSEPEVQAYFTVDSGYYAKWNDIAGENKAARAIEFSLLAIEWAKANSIPCVRTTKDDTHYALSGDTVTFSGLPLGYYLVDSSVGALCALTTTNPEVTMTTKNVPPVLKMQVREDYPEKWDNENTAGIGETVDFSATIDIETGAQNMVFVNTFGAGFKFDEVNMHSQVLVSFYDSSRNQTFTVSPVMDGVTVYTLTNSHGEDNCEFQIEFSPEFCKELAAGDQVVINFQAVVDSDAVIGTDGNPNTAILKYGDNHVTPAVSTLTKLYEFDLLKVDGSRVLLDGATFKIYSKKTENTDGTYVLSEPLVFDPVTGETPVYRLQTIDEDGTADDATLIDVENGFVIIRGLDNGTYFLMEETAPQGYNRIITPIEVTIADSNHKAVMTGGKPNIGTGIQVINNTGTVLPSTGAAGTMMFIGFGMFAVLATGVLLVTKKRMSMIED